MLSHLTVGPVELWVVEIVFYNTGFKIIEDYSLGHAAEVIKRSDVRHHEALLVLGEDKLDVLVPAVRKRSDEAIYRSLSAFNGIVEQPRLEVIDLHNIARVGLYAAGYLFDVQDKLIAPHEPFEARIAHFACKIVSSAQNLECRLRLHAGRFVDQPLQLFELRLKQALFLRRPSVLRRVFFEHLGQVLVVDHCLAVEYSLCP